MLTRFGLSQAGVRLAVSGVVLCALAALSYGIVRLAYGVRPAFVHVRWSASVSDAEQRGIERRYSLTAGEVREGRTWGYYLTDLSRANVRSLVQDPAVEDTHYVNRQAFRVWRTAPRAAYTGWAAPSLPRALDALTIFLLAPGVIFIGLALIERRLPASIRVWLNRAAPWHWLHGCIPDASAESVALFRIVFGAGLVLFFFLKPVSAEWVQVAAGATRLPGLVAPAMRVFEAAPDIADYTRPWLVFWGVLFVAGAFARTSFIMLAGGAIAWALIYTSKVGAHAVSALMIALLCLVWSRWGDAWSIDAWRRRGAPAPARSAREYGYTIWLPGFVMGVTLAAAAVSKLRESGLGWILNGTVKYHFLSDSPQALVDWGLRIGAHHNLAVLLSFGAIAIEGLVIVGACCTSPRIRLATGAAAASLLVGFALFQGLIWPAWWMLLLSFVSWQSLADAVTKRSRSTMAFNAAPHSRFVAVQAVVILAVAGEQFVVSAAKLEVDPLMSTYDMYSTTYASPEDYDAKAGMSYWVVAQLEDGVSESCRIDRRDVDRLSKSEEDRQGVSAVLAACLGRAAPIRSFSLEGRRRAVDWRAWRLAGEQRVAIAGPIVIDSRQ